MNDTTYKTTQRGTLPADDFAAMREILESLEATWQALATVIDTGDEQWVDTLWDDTVRAYAELNAPLKSVPLLDLMPTTDEAEAAYIYTDAGGEWISYRNRDRDVPENEEPENARAENEEPEDEALMDLCILNSATADFKNRVIPLVDHWCRNVDHAYGSNLADLWDALLHQNDNVA